jgi:hypothetical protein
MQTEGCGGGMGSAIIKGWIRTMINGRGSDPLALIGRGSIVPPRPTGPFCPLMLRENRAWDFGHATQAQC